MRVTIDVQDGIADVRLNRPDKLNAFDMAMFEGLAGAIDRLSVIEDLRCVILSGAGRAFSVGIDLDLLSSDGVADLLPRRAGDANLFQHVACGWRALRQPVIVVVHGFAFGAGFQTMLGGDLRISAPGTSFSAMEARWGLVPDMGGFALMRSLVRTDLARMLFFTARRFDAREAERLGLVTQVAEEPMAEALQLAREIAAHPADAIAANKRLHNLALDWSVADILMQESVEQSALLRSPAHRALLAGARTKAAGHGRS